MKQLWASVRKISKKIKLEELLQMNELPNIHDRVDVLDLFHVTKCGPAAIEIAPKNK